jgi:hypothetical protein
VGTTADIYWYGTGGHLGDSMQYNTQVYSVRALERHKSWESCSLLVVTLSLESLVRLSSLGYFNITIYVERKKERLLSSSRHTWFHGYNSAAGIYWYSTGGHHDDSMQ